MGSRLPRAGNVGSGVSHPAGCAEAVQCASALGRADQPTRRGKAQGRAELGAIDAAPCAREQVELLAGSPDQSFEGPVARILPAALDRGDRRLRHPSPSRERALGQARVGPRGAKKIGGSHLIMSTISRRFYSPACCPSTA